MKRLLCLSLLAFTGCFQTYNGDDEDLRTIPVTNNPNIIPNHGNGLPGMGGSREGPY